ncbi:cyclin-T [Uranotaenia lowii]|uniref:cyclin-T n=1 Tax=Uranotaenia lowii TaxID=190385 RepID=UPI0024787862|nr:cyclin-T [Uranotaenia lowii]XP_055602412.1 cyclin-T [Uranotaenia lowii]
MASGASFTVPSGSSTSSSGSSGIGLSSGGSSASSSSSSSSGGQSLARDDSKWYFTSEQLSQSPSRKAGMDADQELMYRQRAANLIQDMGQRLQVSQLCINTAIVYMHRFFAFHSFTQFHRNSIAAAALFLAAKVEEQPRKLEHIIKVVSICLNLEAPDPSKESYAEQAQDLVFNENVLLQTLGFDVAIDHPHTHVVKTCHLVKASKDLAQTSYFMASNSLHLTTMCLQYRPTVVACFCIHLACKWSRWEIPQSNEGRHWFQYVDKTVTLDMLKQLTDEFLHIFDRCPTRLKSKMKSIRADPSEDSSRRSGSSGMPAPSIPRGIDDAGSSSSSSHHRSSSSSHSHSKQSSSSGDPMMKQSSGNHKIPSLSSSSSSRSRNDRIPSSQQQMHAQQQQQMMSGSGGHYGSSSSSGNKMPSSMAHHSSSSRSGMPPTSSSSSSRGPGYMHDGSSRDSKNRMMPTAGGSSSSSSSMGSMHPYGQNKMDRHSSSGSNSSSSQKSQSMAHMDSKSAMKASMMGGHFSATSQPDGRSSTSMVKQQQQMPYGSHPPSYSQSMSNRNSGMPTNESVSVPTSQQFKNPMQPIPTGSESTFRLIDDNNRLADPVQISTPPKQSKPSSIFSPDWKDNQGDSVSNTAGSKSRSQVHPSINPATGKPIKESPSSRDKKPVLPSYADQQGQKPRTETPKKDRRTDSGTGAGGVNHQPKSAEKKSSTTSSSSSSSSLKRSLESNMMPPMSGSLGGAHTGSTIDPIELLGINKIPSSQSSTSKRSLPNSEQVRQEDGTDFREAKLRKVEVPSPSDQLFASTFEMGTTFDKNDDGFSLFSFNDPGSLLSQPLLSDSKPIISGKSSSFPSTLNGIETNPALVSSLLKESLSSNETKFGTLSSNSGSSSASNITGNTTTSGISSAPSLASTGASAALSSTSNLNALSSTQSVLSNVPDKIKKEAPSLIDINAPATISSLLAQPTPAVSAMSTIPTIASNSIAKTSSGIDTLTGDISDSKDDDHRSKSDKKKKKEKHKHKEKNKSKDKDREERKKHKKEKNRHKDRERSDQSADSGTLNPPGPIKIKLPKDKLNLPTLSDGATAGHPPLASDSGLKIKIPKDRLSGSSSINTSGSATTASGSGGSGANTGPPPTNPLKLKISKDKIESYISGTDGVGGFNNGSGHGQGAGVTGGVALGSSGGSGHHGHSSKKKDRDKERDKGKSNKSSSDHKQNGSGGSSSIGAPAGTTTSSKSSSSKQKIASMVSQQQYSLFGTAAGGSDQHPAGTTVPAMPQHPASFDFMQHAQAPTLQQQQQQQQYYSQFGAFNTTTSQQQQQQMMLNTSAMKMSGTGNANNSTGALPNYGYYGSGSQNNGSNTGKK